MRVQVRWALLTSLLILSGLGCADRWLAKRIAGAQPRTSANRQMAQILEPDSQRAHRLRLSEIEAGIAVSCVVLEPGDWQLNHSVEGNWAQRSYSVNLQVSPKGPCLSPPKGTLILLHGYGQGKESMLHWGFFLAQAGYRCVLVDLRGHGDSGGRWLGFGAFEVQDLRRMLDALVERRLVVGQVGALGISYGASVGLRWAAVDPRVRTVVALEPFEDPEGATRTMIGNFPPFQRKLRWLPAGTLEGALQRVPDRAGFRWAELRVEPEVSRLRVPIFLLHGAADVMVPPDHSERLFRSAPAGSRRWVIEGEEHIGLSLRLEPMATEVRGWFDAQLSPVP